MELGGIGRGRQLSVHLPSPIPSSSFPLLGEKYQQASSESHLWEGTPIGLGNGCCLCWFSRSSWCFIFSSVGRGGIG